MAAYADADVLEQGVALPEAADSRAREPELVIVVGVIAAAEVEPAQRLAVATQHGVEGARAEGGGRRKGLKRRHGQDYRGGRLIAVDCVFDLESLQAEPRQC
jgi:hypothetical protein